MTAELHFLLSNLANPGWGLGWGAVTNRKTEPVPTTGLKGHESLSPLLPGPRVCQSSPGSSPNHP